jgi:hypothetical protein
LVRAGPAVAPPGPSPLPPLTREIPPDPPAEVRARFARDQGLPFADGLTELRIRDALNAHGVHYRDRLFSPVATPWGFLSQVLSDDPSCRDAVARVLAHRAASGLGPCSPRCAAAERSAARTSRPTRAQSFCPPSQRSPRKCS